MTELPRIEEMPKGEPTLRAIAMPADANPRGDIFGGWLLSQMDFAGSAIAVRRAKGRTATVAVTSMTFKRPVFVSGSRPIRRTPNAYFEQGDSGYLVSDGLDAYPQAGRRPLDNAYLRLG